MRSSTPRVVAIVPSTIASCQIGVIKPLTALDRKGKINFKWQLESRASLSAVQAADLVVFCRNTEPAYTHLLNEAVSTNKPIIFDLDDNFWDVPFDSDPELARYHRLPLRIQQLEKYIFHANLVRVYSPALKERVAKINPRVSLLKAGFDFNLLRKRRNKSNQEKISIVYATSRIVDNQYKLFSEGLRNILDTYDERVELTIWGCQPGELAGHRGVRLMNLVPDYERFLEEFSARSFDIGLAPLEDTPFHMSKTNTKYRDYGACRVAGVYSNVDVYSSCVQHGKTGILVNNTPEDWFKGVAELIDNSALRASIAHAAYHSVLAEYSQENVEGQWMAEIDELLKTSMPYSIASTADTNRTEILVRADAEGLCGIRFPARSPGDNLPVGKVYLEVMTPERTVLREASATKLLKASDDLDMSFGFARIQNSKHQDFVLRFIRAFEETGGQELQYWLPNSGYIHMLYEEPAGTRPKAASGAA